jgi:fumarate hydratase class II
VNQVHVQIVGNDAAVSTGAAGGQLDLNLYKPVIAHNTLESIALLANASETFAERFVDELEANRERCEQQVERSMALATALNAHIGYEAASEVAKGALNEDKTVREVVIEKGYLDEGEVDEVLDARAMTERGIPGREE